MPPPPPPEYQNILLRLSQRRTQTEMYMYFVYEFFKFMKTGVFQSFSEGQY